MALPRIVLGWLAVSTWFLVFELIEQRLRRLPAPEGRRLRASWKLYVADALIFTLFATLWFASLGHGGWVLLFLMLGLLLEGPARYRDGTGEWELSIRGLLRLLPGVVRSVAAGGLLAFIL
jgi:hypothetical protein